MLLMPEDAIAKISDTCKYLSNSKYNLIYILWRELEYIVSRAWPKPVVFVTDFHDFAMVINFL
jgi:hypothetical protein